MTCHSRTAEQSNLRNNATISAVRCEVHQARSICLWFHPDLLPGNHGHWEISHPLLVQQILSPNSCRGRSCGKLKGLGGGEGWFLEGGVGQTQHAQWQRKGFISNNVVKVLWLHDLLQIEFFQHFRWVLQGLPSLLNDPCQFWPLYIEAKTNQRRRDHQVERNVYTDPVVLPDVMNHPIETTGEQCALAKQL